MAGVASMTVAITPADSSLNIVMEFLLLYVAAQRLLASHNRKTDQGDRRSSITWSPNAPLSIKNGFMIGFSVRQSLPDPPSASLTPW
jgi:hypothetical protein